MELECSIVRMNYYITYPNELTGARDIVSPPLSWFMATQTLLKAADGQTQGKIFKGWPNPELLGLVSEEDTNQLLFNL